ncbi:MAG: BrnA antitoxin family protein [Dehalococcoidia bacterium]|jgi:uncharacterized protein (DUF4415 family)|uniref:BrnA antitoxin of type II toxin-antitoxin system n=1 Tax=uncultured marine microorganism HF4000_APKG2J17 TaxID=455546 RepID=B3T6K9_9ZZZZ|nr:hypothetical protein ALOHA_HF4000APKG2J17ctg1g25 [uncultured marine microorganism HF4000_APKG2J17]MCH2520128.1 BrnA antitoxin family protein [Dehalococcoidia bacterium]
MKKRPKHISQEDWDAVDSPPLTGEQLARMRPMREVHPEIVESYLRSRGAQKAPTKISTTIRLDADVLEHFKRGGKGWQTRMNEALRKAIAP